MKVPSFLVAAAVAALATPAVAGAPQAPRLAVHYADLDLTTEAGQATLATRIDWAAQSVCGVATERYGSMLPSPHAKACYVRAKSSALERVAELAARAKARG